MGVFGHFREFASLDFSDFAYYDRQAWYLTGTGGPVAEKNFLAQIWAFLGPNLAQNRVFGNYLDLDPYDLSDIAHSGWIQCYLTTNGDILCLPIFLAKIRAILGPNLAQNPVFGKYLDLDLYDLSDIAHSGWFQWYLTTNGSFYAQQKFLA